MKKFSRLQDFEDHALKALPQDVAGGFKYGAGRCNTLKLNSDAYKKIRVLPRVLRDVSERDTSTTILGEKVSTPVGVSPTGAQRYAHPDGECATVKAAESANTVFIMSSFANSTLEQVSRAGPGAIKWFQMTILRNRDHTEYLVRKAELNGFKAIVLTVDDPIIPKSKWQGVIQRFSNFAVFEDLYASETPDEVDPVSTVNEKFDDSLTWEDLTWLKSVTKLPIVLKGVLSPKDAVLAVKYGASGLLVSNHGGRQYDGAPATIEILPKIVEAVGDKIEVYVDGGVREGSDVFKAIALGAKMVFIGRPILWGLACGGEAGAREVLRIMTNEIDEILAFTGCRNLGEVTKDMIIHESELWNI